MVKPRMYPNQPAPLVPMAVRVTKLQSDRLAAVRSADGMSAQEHIRRAIDEYLDRIEKILKAKGHLAQALPVPADNAPVSGSTQGSPTVVLR